MYRQVAGAENSSWRVLSMRKITGRRVTVWCGILKVRVSEESSRGSVELQAIREICGGHGGGGCEKATFVTELLWSRFCTGFRQKQATGRGMNVVCFSLSLTSLFRSKYESGCTVLDLLEEEWTWSAFLLLLFFFFFFLLLFFFFFLFSFLLSMS